MSLHPRALPLVPLAHRSATLLLLLAAAGCGTRVELAQAAAGTGPGNDVDVVSPPTVTRVSSKWAHLCSIDATSHLHCWGQNLAGELGVPGAATFAPAPLAVDPDHTYREVSAGVGTTCAIRSEGSLFCWGRNHGGPLATGDSDPHDAPLQIGDAEDWERVSIGSGLACGLRAGGQMYCWGSQDFGELAQPPLSPKALKEPTLIEGTWVALSSHWYLTIAVRDDGSLWVSNNDGVFAKVGGFSGKAREISVGVLYALVVDDQGTLTHLSFPESEQEAFPTVLMPGVPFVGAMASAYGSCAISADRRMYCTADASYTVPDLAPLEDQQARWTSVGVGNRYGCSAAEDETIWCWGTLHSDSAIPSMEYGEAPVQVE
ncbi:MAG: hypothetical protein ABI193_12235 [Minicystis sp.]